MKFNRVPFVCFLADFVRIQLVFQLVNLGQPYDPCKKNAPPIATCLQECKKKAAEVKCSCSDTMDTFPDNITMATCDVLGTLCTLKLRGTYSLFFTFTLNDISIWYLHHTLVIGN